MIVKKSKIISVSIIAVLALSFPVSRAFPMGMDYLRGKTAAHKADSGRLQIYEGLNLTAAQKDLLEQNKNKNREQMDALRKAMQDDMAQIGRELEKGELDTSKINQINDDLKKIRSQMLDLRLSGILEVRKILTPWQFKKFMDKMNPGSDKFKNKWEARGPSTAPYKAEVYFSPDEGIGDRLIKAVDDAAGTMDIAIFNLTFRELKLALERAKSRGVKIRIIADSQEVKDPHSQLNGLADEGFDIKLVHGRGKNGIMHNKFAVFDGKLLVTGSYNWTFGAEHFNYENAVFISDPEVIRKYQKEFNEIWNNN